VGDRRGGLAARGIDLAPGLLRLRVGARLGRRDLLPRPVDGGHNLLSRLASGFGRRRLGGALCARDRLVRAGLRAGDLRRRLLAGLADAEQRVGGGPLGCRLGGGGFGAVAVRASFRVAGALEQDGSIAAERGGRRGERGLGRLSVGGKLLSRGVGVSAQPDGVVALAFGGELGAPGTRGVFF